MLKRTWADLCIFYQAPQSGARKGPEHHTRVPCVTMADLQMKLLRRKINKRNERNKERKLQTKRAEEEANRECYNWKAIKFCVEF